MTALKRSTFALISAILATLTLSLAGTSTTALAQRVQAQDDVEQDSRVPGWLRDRPLGLTWGYYTSYEGSGELIASIGLASDYSSAMSAASALQSLSSIDIPVLSLRNLKVGLSGNLLAPIAGSGPKLGLDALDPSLSAGIWGSAGIESIAVDAKILGKVWSPEVFLNAREGYEAQIGLTIYSPMMRLGGGRFVDLSVRGDLTLADDSYMDQHFGISEAEALTSGLDAYSAPAGLKSAGLSIGTAVPLTRNFELQGAVGLVQLLDGAAASPWVQERGEATDIWGNFGFAFRF